MLPSAPSRFFPKGLPWKTIYNPCQRSYPLKRTWISTKNSLLLRQCFGKPTLGVQVSFEVTSNAVLTEKGSFNTSAGSAFVNKSFVLSECYTFVKLTTLPPTFSVTRKTTNVEGVISMFAHISDMCSRLFCARGKSRFRPALRNLVYRAMHKRNLPSRLEKCCLAFLFLVSNHILTHYKFAVRVVASSRDDTVRKEEKEYFPCSAARQITTSSYTQKSVLVSSQGSVFKLMESHPNASKVAAPQPHEEKWASYQESRSTSSFWVFPWKRSIYSRT